MRQLIPIAIFFLCCVAGFGQTSKRYDDSFAMIDGMINGKTYSFKKAVMSVENAYFDGRLDTVAFNQQIDALTMLASEVRQSRDLEYKGSDKEKVSTWAALFAVMTDTLRIEMPGNRLMKYFPFRYDFEDIFGHGEWSNMFVSKLLQTKSGNCHSLPYLYKILAEEMGVNASLSLAPNHIYIKLRSQRDGWYNTELTSGMFPVDAWLMASGYIHLDAITNGVYMKALSDKESLALVMIDLAQAFQHRYPDNDGSFILRCCDAALAVYPNFANALILHVETQMAVMERQKDFENAKEIIPQLEKQYAYIHSLGYRNMPEKMYLDWLASLKSEREKYVNKKLDNFNQH